MQARRLVSVLGVVLGTIACGGANDGRAVQAPLAATTGDAGAPADAASPVAAPVPDAGSTGDAGACGCHVCAPVVSNDACTTDADCAPSQPCHAPACVGKANAQPRTPGQMCTQQLICTTVDANACGCVHGKCTLYAR
jgi:hypothetical protein